MKIKPAKMDFRDRNLIFFDLETTGLEPGKHEIIELGCILVDGRTLEIKETFVTKVLPVHLETADQEGLEVSGYSDEKWKDAIPSREALTKFNMLAKNGMLAGWNVQFDWSMIDAAFSSLQIEAQFDYHSIDVLSIAYTKLLKVKMPEKVSLGETAKFFNIEVNGRHSSLGDIMATFEIYKRLLQL